MIFLNSKKEEGLPKEHIGDIMWKDTLRKAPFSGSERQKQYQDRDEGNRNKLKQHFPRTLKNLFDDIYDKAISKNPNYTSHKLSLPIGLRDYILQMKEAGIQENEIVSLLKNEYDAKQVAFDLDAGAYGTMVITL